MMKKNIFFITGGRLFNSKIIPKYNIERHILKLKRVYKIETQSIRECERTETVRETGKAKRLLGLGCAL
jgi:hypothetical protein